MDKSSYKVYWVELTPKKGIVTKSDRKAFGEAVLSGNEKKHYKHFSSKKAAIDWLMGFNKKLDKKYTALLFTDKQFSMAKADNGEMVIPFTEKQSREVYEL